MLYDSALFHLPACSRNALVSAMTEKKGRAFICPICITLCSDTCSGQMTETSGATVGPAVTEDPCTGALLHCTSSSFMLTWIELDCSMWNTRRKDTFKAQVQQMGRSLAHQCVKLGQTSRRPSQGQIQGPSFFIFLDHLICSRKSELPFCCVLFR